MNEIFAKAKGDASQMEDTWIANQRYWAVFDGATAKAAFRFPDGRTPGQVAAQTLAEATATLPAEIEATAAIGRLTTALHKALDGHRGEASGVIYNIHRREIWMVGDCQCAFLLQDGTLECHHPEKAIDHLLSHWRSDIIRSYLSRGLMTIDEIRNNDPGRKIIQPFISRQVMYQNLNPDPNLNLLRANSSRDTSEASLSNLNDNLNDNPNPLRANSSRDMSEASLSNPNRDLESKNARTENRLAFGVFDGTPIPECFIEIYPVPQDATAVILASDGYPQLYPTLKETEEHLQQLLAEDPLCIGPLCGTKGIRPGNEAHDDRTYLRCGTSSPACIANP